MIMQDLCKTSNAYKTRWQWFLHNSLNSIQKAFHGIQANFFSKVISEFVAMDDWTFFFWYEIFDKHTDFIPTYTYDTHSEIHKGSSAESTLSEIQDTTTTLNKGMLFLVEGV